MRQQVAPLAGVWIEIGKGYYSQANRAVAPLAGVWIEINSNPATCVTYAGRSPCGSVD